MDYFKAKLIDVKTGDFNSLVFESTKFDFGLQKEVPCSVNVMIAKEHEFLLSEYRSRINSIVIAPVRLLVTKKQSIMRITGSDGILSDSY